MAVWSNPFGGAQHVVCPVCRGQAIIQEWQLICTACTHRTNLAEAPSGKRTLPVRCTNCGAQTRPKRHAYRPRCDGCGALIDRREPLFGCDEPLPLWAETSTRHGVLWAMNPQHLTALRRYIAGNREKPYIPERGTRRTPNRDWRSRLPRWVKLARNRREILRALDRLEARFAERS